MQKKSRLKSWRAWLHGMVAAFIGGVANGVLLILVDPVKFNFREGLHDLIQCAVASAVINVCFYIKNSRIPDDEDEADEAENKIVDAVYRPSRDRD